MVHSMSNENDHNIHEELDMGGRCDQFCFGISKFWRNTAVANGSSTKRCHLFPNFLHRSWTVRHDAGGWNNNEKQTHSNEI